MKIRFLQDYTVKAVGGQSYKKDEVIDLPESSAQHFINRRRAEFYKAKAEAIPIKAEPVAEAEPIPQSEGEPQTEEGAPDTPAPSVADKPLGSSKRGRPSKQVPKINFENAPNAPDPLKDV